MNAILMNIVYFILAEAFYRLKLSESWRGLQKSQEGFSKEDKEALNALVAMVLVPIFQSEYGLICSIENMAKYVLYRIFKKAFLWDSKPQNKRFLEQKIDFDAEAKKYVKECIRKMLNEYREEENYKAACALATDVLSQTDAKYRASFSYSVLASSPATEEDIERLADWICGDLANCDPNVEYIYEAAKDLTTVIEYEEVRDNLRADAVDEIKKSVYSKLDKFHDHPIIYEIALGTGKYGKLNQLLHTISWARYTFRWQGYKMTIRCSILTHMLETGLLGYVAAYEGLQKATNEQEYAERKAMMEKAFKVGLFHDVAEIWTDDIPSPAKDGMGIRPLAEEQELHAIEEKFYPNLPEYVVEFFRNGVMLEDTKDLREKSFYKAADYFSADLEVWWNIRAGARDKRLLRILQKSLKCERTPGQLTSIQYFLLEMKGVKFYL
ncbi:MAG: HD domain-containing protein [Clostridia bacterium]|nr:HD domain-containing protein [Clostridia bacterium]